MFLGPPSVEFFENQILTSVALEVRYVCSVSAWRPLQNRVLIWIFQATKIVWILAPHTGLQLGMPRGHVFFSNLYPEWRVKLVSLLPGWVFPPVHALKISLRMGGWICLVSDRGLTPYSGLRLRLLSPVLMGPFKTQDLGHLGLANFLGHLQTLEEFFLFVIASFPLSALLQLNPAFRVIFKV